MADTLFASLATGLGDPASHAVAVTPSDTTTLTTTRFVFVGTGNTNMTVVTAAAETVTFTNIPNGFLLPIRVTQIHDTNTDATGIVALW